MKRYILALILMSVIPSFFTADSLLNSVFAAVDKFNPRDGTYEGRSFKFPGTMKVAVVIEQGKIKAITILKHLALQKYTDMLRPLIDRIIAKQSLEVDAVTGATISSSALKYAVKEALKKASNDTREVKTFSPERK